MIAVPAYMDRFEAAGRGAYMGGGGIKFGTSWQGRSKTQHLGTSYSPANHYIVLKKLLYYLTSGPKI